MARFVSAQTGNFSTAATWNTPSHEQTFDDSSAVFIGTGNYNSATFTAPSLTDSSTGVLLYFTNVRTGGSVLTASLQEFNGATWGTVASNTINLDDFEPNTFAQIRWSAAYMYTTLTAGYYRIQLTLTGGTGSTYITGDGSGSYFYVALDDSNATTPGAGDDVVIVGDGSTEIVVTLDGSQTIGSGAEAGALIANRGFAQALLLGAHGTAYADRASDSDLTIQGHIKASRLGKYDAGTSIDPVTGVEHVIYMDQNGTSNNYGIYWINNSEWYMYGDEKSSETLWRGTYASGDGTTGNELTLNESVDWDVDDRILVTASSNNAANYNETEYKYIKTKVSATEYTLADTVGGAESGLSYTKIAGAHIANIQRNVRIERLVSTENYYISNDQGEQDQAVCKWVEFKGLGDFASDINRRGLAINTNAARYMTVDYSVFTENKYHAVLVRQTKIDHQMTGNVFCEQLGMAANVGMLQVQTNANNKTFSDCFFVDSERMGARVDTSANVTFNDCVFAGNNSDNNANCGGIYALNARINFNNCDFYSNRYQAIKLANLTSDSTGCTFGTYGSNGNWDIGLFDDYFNDITWSDCAFDNTTTHIQSNYDNQIDGSEIRFDEFDQTTNNHTWYTPYGVARSTGSGLVDSNVRTADSLGLRIAPEDSTAGFKWEFQILAKANSAVSITGFIQKNALFGSDDVTVEMFLPGSTTADDSQTMPNDTNWNVFNLAANYTGSVDRYATIRVTAKTTTSGAYIYVDDLYNGTNNITALDLWSSGKPSSIMFEQLGDAAAVWAVATSTLTTEGTTGYVLANQDTVIADAVWDEVIDNTNHNGAKSAGKRLRQAGTLVAVDGEITGTPTTTSFTTDISETTDDHYRDQTFVFTGGDLEGQARIVTSYVGATKTFTFDEAWTDAPSAGDEFEVRADHIHSMDEYEELLQESRIMLNVAYNEDGDEFEANAWVETEGVVDTSASTFVITVYDADGTSQFSLNQASPNSEGVFTVRQSSPGFTEGDTYYVVLSVVSGGDTITTNKGLVTTN